MADPAGKAGSQRAAPAPETTANPAGTGEPTSAVTSAADKPAPIPAHTEQPASSSIAVPATVSFTSAPPAHEPPASETAAQAPVPAPAPADTAEAPYHAVASSSSTPAPAAAAGPSRPAPAEATIEVDEETPTVSSVSDPEDEAFFGSDDGGSSATTSLSSSVRNYAFENSRRYHRFKEGRYHFPNDDIEQEREDMRHCMMVHVAGGALHYAPLQNPQKILDIGTGTGIWAIDMGDEYPEAEVVGIDLSPIQPTWVPANVRFIVDDAESPWVSAPNTYDYIHIRGMAPAIKNWQGLMEQAFTALKPGGWIEIQDLNWIYFCDDDTMGPDYAVVQMATYIRQGLQAFGIQVNAAEKNPERLAAAGYVDIRHTRDKVPVGTWPRDPNMKTIGLYNRSAVYDGLQGITMGPLTRGLKWTPEEVEVFLVKVRKDLLNSRIHSYVYMHTLCGQKPL